ncbi:uncharacterized protein [Panulirus ornatus]
MAVKEAHPSAFLLSHLSQVVRGAKLNDEVEAVEKNHFSYKCKICHGKKSFNGLVPLESHLNGKEHEKSKKTLQLRITFPTQPSHLNVALAQDTAKQNTVASYGESPYKVPECVQQPNAIYSGKSNQVPESFQNIVASNKTRIQVPISAQQSYAPDESRTSLHQTHFPSDVGLSHCSAPPRPSIFPVVHQPNPSIPSPSKTFASLATSHDACGGVAMKTVSNFLAPVPLSTRAKEALSSGVVVEKEGLKSGVSYFCNICLVPLNGVKPLEQHVDGEKHKKVQMSKTPWMQSMILPDIASLKVGEAAQQWPILSSDSKKIQLPVARTPIRIDQTDQMRPFPWTVRPCETPVLPSTHVYKNLSTPRGRVYVFNYPFFGEHQRFGAEKDSYNLRELFTAMGYHVKVYEGLNRQETVGELKRIQLDRSLEHCDSFILIILSHGKKNLTFFTNDCREDQQMSLDDVRYLFVDGECPSLKNKPKIFLVNFCRGKISEEVHSLEHDQIEEQRSEAPQDMMTIYASIENFKALRHPEKGTVFVLALCEVLAENAHNTDLKDLYVELCKTMRANEGTTPEQQIYNFKRFYFNPI